MNITRRHGALGAAFLVALWLAVWGDKTPVNLGSDSKSVSPALASPAAVVTVKASAGTTSATRPAPGAQRPASAPAVLVSRAALLQAADGPAGNIFPARSGDTSATRRAALAQPAAPSQALAPSYTVLGKQFDGSQWAVYLGRGEQVWVVREGQAFDSDYTVQSLKPPQLSLLHRPSGVLHSLDIGSTP